jgi:signal transduction histidine kinase
MALHLVAYFKPEYVGGYENEEIRFLDILITTLYIITALFAFLKIYRKNYIIEREKANSRKIEVEKLNKTLEDSNNKINIQNQKLEDLSNDLIKKHLIIKTQLKEINKANSELKSLNHTKDKFFAIISHDLKNPVGSFKSITESIKDNFEFYSEAEQKDIINLMSQSSNKLYDLLINLLTWANIQTGSLTLNPGFNDMSKLIKENEDLFRLSALNKGIQIVNKVQSPVTAYFDYEMIDTVIRNLISNAIKFTPKDGLVEINSFKDDNNLRIDITDNGVGISDEDLKLMFRIDVNYKLIGENENEKGTGLGLILCKEFVELNKGSINIRSVLGKGTTISFNLPLNNI